MINKQPEALHYAAIERKDALLRQALEALEYVKGWDNGKPAWEHLYSAIDAIQQELSQ